MRILSVVIIACFLCTISFADVITNTLSEASTTVGQFNPALGTLTSVTLSITTDAPANAIVDITHTGPQDFYLIAAMSVISVDVGGLFGIGTVELTKSVDDSDIFFDGPNLLDDFSLGDSDSATMSSNLSGFIGAGTLVVSDSQYYDSWTDGPLDITVSNLDGFDEWSGTLNYTYDAIPEPVTMTLIGLGGVLLVAVRRIYDRMPSSMLRR